MNLFWTALVVAMPCPAVNDAAFSGNQIDVALSLAQYFNVAFCLLEKKKKQKSLDLIPNDVHPSKRFLMTGSLIFEEISALIAKGLEDKTMIVLKMSNDTLTSLQQLSEIESLSSAIWIIFSDRHFQIDDFRQIYIPFDCEFIYVSENVEDSTFSVTELYQIEKKVGVESYDLGNWTRKNGLLLVDQDFYARRNNLKGHKLKGVIRNDPPYVFTERNGEEILKLGGYLYEIWCELESRINFSSEFPKLFLGKDPKWALKTGGVDFALARIANNPSTFPFMDFSHPINEAKFFMFGHRPGSELDWDSYLKPFSPNTWLINLVWMTFSSAALAILYKIAWEFGTSEREAKYFIFTFSESLLTVFRAICMQGSDVTPRSSSCRLLFLSVYLTALVVTSAFSAALFSLLTIPKPRAPFTSLEEVLDNGRYVIGLPSDPNFQKLMEDFSDTLHSATRRKFLEKLFDSSGNVSITPDNGLLRLCSDRSYVFLFDLPNVLYLMQNMTRSCQDKILPSGPPLFTELIGFGFRKKNPFKKLIDFHLIRMKNEGILNRLLFNYWPPRIPTVQATWVRVTLSDISPILYMFALGAVVGGVLLYAERIYLKMRKKNIYFRGFFPGTNRNHFEQEAVWSDHSSSRWETYFARYGKELLAKI